MYLDPVKYQGDMQNHERLHMFARDIIRVRNPLAEDFRFKYDSVWYTVKANSMKDMERYLADKFVWDISQLIINQIIYEEGEKALANYVKMNPNLLLDKYAENRMIWDKIPRVDDPKLQKTVVRNVVVGLVEKFGEDREMPAETAKIDRNTPLYKELLTEFTKVPLAEMSQEEKAEIDALQRPAGTPADVARNIGAQATLSTTQPANVNEVTTQ